MDSRLLNIIIDHFIIFWPVCFLFHLYDYLLYNSGNWNKFKINSKKSPVNFSTSFFIVLFNQIFISIPLFYFLDIPDDNSPLFSIENLYRIPIALILLEFLFYYSHRLFHTKYLYYFHKLHHSWTSPQPISALYSHPIEHIFINILPAFLAAKFSYFSYPTLRFWHAFGLINSLIVSHGGYSNISEIHDIHHSKQIYNYGVLGILDYLHNTYKKN